MMWEPISEAELKSLVTEAEAAMAPPVFAFWKQIRIRPVRWNLSPWGDLGGGFWVVAIIGQTCFWYNDIEDGFNIGCFHSLGSISEYSTDQWQLELRVNVAFRDFKESIAGYGEPVC